MFDAVELSQKFQLGISNPLKEMERVEKEVNANSSSAIFIHYCFERAWQEAEASHKRWLSNRPLSLFDGIPIAWKDLIDVAGTPTTAGSKVFKNNLKTVDAKIVSQLCRYGMITVGKTNLTEFAYSGLGLNPHYGTPSNVYSPQHIPGGSSSGSAIVVGKKIVPIAMGTDTAGSIRIPSAFNGLVGYRSSCQRYSSEGVFPLAESLDTLGPIAHSVRDCLILDSLLQNYSLDMVPKTTEEVGTHFKVDPYFIESKDIEDDVKTQFINSLEKIKSAGGIIVYEPIKAFRQALEIIDSGLWLGAAEAYTLHQDLLHSEQAQLLDERVRIRLEKAKDIKAYTQIKLYQLAKQFKSLIRQELGHAMLLTPTVAHTAPLFADVERSIAQFFEINSKTLRLTMPGSFLDMPAVSLPNGFDSQGLPTGILISTFSGNDDVLLQKSMWIEKVISN